MAALFNMRRMTVTSVGTGALSLGVAPSGWRAFSAAPAIPDGTAISYRIDDGGAWELGVGTYNVAGLTLSRTLRESSTGALLNVTTAATLTIVALAEDFASSALGGAPASSFTPVITYSEHFDYVLSSNGLPSSGFNAQELQMGKIDTQSGTSANAAEGNGAAGRYFETGAGTTGWAGIGRFVGDQVRSRYDSGSELTLTGLLSFNPDNLPPTSATDYVSQFGFGFNLNNPQLTNVHRAVVQYRRNGASSELVFETQRWSEVQTTVLAPQAAGIVDNFAVILICDDRVVLKRNGVVVATHTVAVPIFQATRQLYRGCHIWPLAGTGNRRLFIREMHITKRAL